MPESPGDRIKKAVDRGIRNCINAHGQNPSIIVLNICDFEDLWHRIKSLKDGFMPPRCPHCGKSSFSYGDCDILPDFNAERGEGKIDDEFWTFYAYEPE